MTDMLRLEGSDKLLEKALARLPAKVRLRGLKPAERLVGLKPEERLVGLKPEERLVGLKPEELLLGFSDAQLRQLPPQFLKSLPPAARRQIQRRLKKS